MENKTGQPGSHFPHSVVVNRRRSCVLMMIIYMQTHAYTLPDEHTYIHSYSKLPNVLGKHNLIYDHFVSGGRWSIAERQKRNHSHGNKTNGYLVLSGDIFGTLHYGICY